MKTEYWLIVLVFTVLAGLGIRSAAETRLEAQAAALADAGTRTDTLRAERYWRGVAALPPATVSPLDALWISSGTGYRTDPMGGSEGERLHKGIDLAGPVGMPVRAVRAGVVAEHWVPPDGGRWQGHPVMGGYIVIDHGNGLYTAYGHLSDSWVHEGDWVEAGQVIGALGVTGLVTGPHLHFEVIVEPLGYLGVE